MSQIKQDLKAALARICELEKSHNAAVNIAANHKGTAQAMQMLSTECLNLMRLLVGATDIRALPGVYFLMNKSGGIIYVGQSENVMFRMSGHKEKEFHSVRMIHIARPNERIRIETRFIHLLQPPINLQYLGPDNSQELLGREFEFAN